jgi:hypothetical protein
MSAGIEKPSFSSGLAVTNGGLSCSLVWFGQPDSNDPRHPERNKIDSKKNDHGIRQIEAKALRKLKHPSRSRILKSFLDN